ELLIGAVPPLVARPKKAFAKMLKEIAPSVKRITLVFNPQTARYYPGFLRDFGGAAATLAVELSAAPVHDEAEIEAAVSASAREPESGLIAAPDPFINSHRALLVGLAQRHRLPVSQASSRRSLYAAAG